ncbi:hypothetical protein [Enterocloster hominis (ex Hitch et al. 2024)]|uniref:GNAT family N-acetyltransferase n=1 Tax=Enterocloster hominis (ex Hitch et al. 2024) TaxID=1917870 RepID=A0ABV1DF40_9FIRM
MLYQLILTDLELSYDNFSEDFHIGLFETERQAEDTALYYLKSIKGFCDFPCTYRIVKKEVVGGFNNRNPDFIWMVQGWNLNENLDEIDIIESPCFLTEEQAGSELQVLKGKYQRAEWSLDKYRIGALEWCDGFVRMAGGVPAN